MSTVGRIIQSGPWQGHAIRKARQSLVCVECGARLGRGVKYVVGEATGFRIISGARRAETKRAAHCMNCAGHEARAAIAKAEGEAA